MGAEMDAIFVVLVCVSLIVLMLVLLWQNKTLTELWAWVDLHSNRLDKTQSLIDSVRARLMDTDRAVGRLEAKVERLEEEIKK